MSTRSIPKAACTFQVSEFTVTSNGSDAKTAPFKMLARSAQPITHWFFGKIAHDLSGMDLRGRNRVAVDWQHGDKLLGYANHFKQTNEGLEVSGALIPFKDDDITSEVIYKAAHGVPLEASISWGGENTEIEDVAEGQESEVNGYKFSGPGVIVRSWPLRSIGIVKEGADQYTSTEFSDGEKITVNVIDKSKGDSMTKAKFQSVEIEDEQVEEIHDAVEVVQDAIVAVVEAVEVIDEVVNNTEEEEDTEDDESVEVSDEDLAANVEATKKAGRHSAVEPNGEDYMKTFGEAQGAVYFAKGIKFGAALQLHIKKQAKRIEELESQLVSNDRGLSSPVEFRKEPVEKGPTSMKELIKIRK
jgi:hypothetical protein